MATGNVTVRLNLNSAGYSAAMAQAQRSMHSFTSATQQMGHGTVTQMQAASAAIRTLEGGMTNSIRAAERFISTIPGVGKALQAAFPVVGAIAFIGVIARIGEEAYKAAHELGQIRNVANESFSAMTDGARKNADSLRVSNDRLEQQIAELEHKPVNNLALALDEARLRADELASSLDKDYQSFKKIIEETQKGVLSTLLNKGVDAQLGGSMEDQLANIRTLARQQRDALAAGNQASADDLGQKLRAAQQQAIGFASSETARRSGIENVGTVRQAPFAMVHGDQGQNFDAINAFKDLVSDQMDTADEQKRNTTDTAKERALQAANKAQAQMLQQMQEGLAKQKALYGVSVADELAYWSARIDAFNRGSEQYHTVQTEQYRLQAELYQKLNEGKKKYLDSSKSDVEGGDIMAKAAETFKKIDLEQMERRNEATAKYNELVHQGDEEQRKAQLTFTETALKLAVMQGAISKLEAAQILAAAHAQEHARALLLVNEQLEAQTRLINQMPDEKMNPEAKADAIRNAQQSAFNQTAGINSSYQIAQLQDAQAIQSENLGTASKQALGRMVNDWGSMTQSIVQVMTRAIDSLNNDIVKLITGQGKKGDFGHTFLQAGQGLLKTGLEGAEGKALKAFGIGKRDGSSAGSALYVIPTNGALPGASTSGGAATGALGGIMGKIGPFIQPFIPHFAEGGDFMSGHPMVVGESGPELLMPRSAGTVIPNSMLGGGDTHIHVDARGSNDPSAIHAAVSRAVSSSVVASMHAQHQAKMRTPHGR